MKAKFRISIPKSVSAKKARTVAEQTKDPGSRLYERKESKALMRQFVNRDSDEFERGKFHQLRGPGGELIVEGKLKKKKAPKYRKPS